MLRQAMCVCVSLQNYASSREVDPRE
jgi:hypothetical protein